MLSQRQEEEQTNSQPFFKPSTQSQNASHSFFIFGDRESKTETTRSNASSIFQDTQPQQASSVSTHPLQIASNLNQATSSMPEQPFLQQQQKSSNLQLDSMSEGSDRLSMIHTRLHHEADKIRSWKVQTEMELKQREKNLQDSQLTIDSQKKSILELQLQNENLSRKLKEEMDNRTDISERIEATRDMCNLLKDYTSKFQERMTLCENDRDELKAIEKQHMEDTEELGDMFKDLSLLHTNKVNDLILTLETEKNSNLKNNEQLISQLRETQLKLKDLEKELKEKENDISQLTLKKQEVALQLTRLQEENSSLQNTLTEALGKIQTQVNNLEQAHQDKQGLQTDKDTLTSEKLELQQALQSQNKHTEDLKQNIQDLKEHIHEITTDKEKLSNEIQSLRQNLEIKVSETDTLKDELKVVLEREQASYDKVDSIKKEKEAERAENINLSELLKTSQDKTNSLESQLQAKGEELNKLNNELETLQKTSEQEKLDLEAAVEKTEKLEEEINNLRELQTEQDMTSVQTLQEEKAKSDTLNKDLAALNKQTTSLETKNKNLHTQLTTKTKQLKDLQQEMKTLKGNLTKQIKLTTAAETQVSEATEEIEKKTTELEEISTKFTSVTEDLQQERVALEELKTKLTEAQKEASDKTNLLADKTILLQTLEAETETLRKKTETATKEHGDAKQACELQMIEVSATLDKYKAENERMVAQKDKEIKQLQKDMEQQKQKQVMEEEQMTSFTKEVQGLKEKLVEAQTERDEAKKQISSHSEIVMIMKKNLKEKEDELKKLQSATSLAMSEPMTGVSPIAPKRNTPLPRHSTPKHPASVSHTPKTPLTADKPLMVTPCMKTPQRHSILKQTESVPRKRHVVFVSEEEDSADGSMSDSSSSQLMEIELSEVERRLVTSSSKRPSQSVQPLHVTPSRKGQSPQFTKTASASKTTPTRPPPKQNQYSQKSKSHLKHKKMRAQADTPTEMTQSEVKRFKELYPEEVHNDALHPSSKTKPKKKTSSASDNTRKAPNRIFKVKGVKDSYRGSSKKDKTAGKANKEVDLSWFDSDSVYGFFD
ncbi:uncharacterized protein [Asterias amurensis]|uniref:uncharacterized protein n=1 Tax=Asterias amurensis TaxID=7602 RepID=UPI003AB854EE